MIILAQINRLNFYWLTDSCCLCVCMSSFTWSISSRTHCAYWETLCRASSSTAGWTPLSAPFPSSASALPRSCCTHALSPPSQVESSHQAENYQVTATEPQQSRKLSNLRGPKHHSKPAVFYKDTHKPVSGNEEHVLIVYW